MRKLFGAVLGAVMVAALFVLASPAPANAADSNAEAQFVAQINSIRASHGLAPLAVYGELHSVARSWTDQMVGAGGISHNPNLAGDVSANWTKLGENVGVGGSVSSLMQAFVASPAHYKNIVDPAYNYIGVGVSYDDTGRMFTTHDFMALGEAPPPPADDSGSSAPAPAPRKKSSTPPADSAPTPDAAPAPTEPPPPPTAPATSGRVHTVLTALRAVEG